MYVINNVMKTMQYYHICHWGVPFPAFFIFIYALPVERRLFKLQFNLHKHFEKCKYSALKYKSVITLNSGTLILHKKINIYVINNVMKTMKYHHICPWGVPFQTFLFLYMRGQSEKDYSNFNSIFIKHFEKCKYSALNNRSVITLNSGTLILDKKFNILVRKYYFSFNQTSEHLPGNHWNTYSQ